MGRGVVVGLPHCWVQGRQGRFERVAAGARKRAPHRIDRPSRRRRRGRVAIGASRGCAGGKPEEGVAFGGGCAPGCCSRGCGCRSYSVQRLALQAELVCPPHCRRFWASRGVKGWCAGLRPRQGRGGRTAAEGGSLGLRGGGLPVGRGVRAGWSADMGRKEAVAFQRSLELGGAPFRRSRRCGPQVFSGKERPAFCVGGVCVGRRVATGACRACAGRAVDCSVLWWRAPVLWRGRCARHGAAGEGGAVFPCRIRVRG